MRVAVTGGSGQLGTLVLRRLLADARVSEVVSLDLRPPLVASPKLTAIRADVRESALERRFEGCEAVFHLAFVVAAWKPREELHAINVLGSENVFRAAIAGGARRIVYASSVAAYGVVPGHPVPIREDARRVLQEALPYAAAKWRVEETLDRLEAAHPEVAFVRLRPAILLGRGMDHPLGSELRARRIPRSAVPLPVVWDEDVADAAILALSPLARGAYNLSADEPLATDAIVRETGFRHSPDVPRWAGRLYGRVVPLLARLGLPAVDPSWVELDEAPLIVSSERAKRELLWRPSCPTVLSVVRRFDAVVPRRLDPRISATLRLAAIFGKKDGKNGESRARIHLCLTGPRGGDLTLLARRARLRVARGAPRPPTATVTLEAPLLWEALAGRADLREAFATGAARVEGQEGAGEVLAALVERFSR